MGRRFRYLSHPQVLIVPDRDVRQWSLNDTGRSRVDALAKSNALHGTATIVSSAETKAIQTATPLARCLGRRVHIREDMHENDRSSTGFLPPDEFEAVADQFFAQPEVSVRGWETALAAQSRIVGEMRHCLARYTEGDLLFVGHGGVGTLLFCHLSGLPISRDYDQGADGGGCFFEFSDQQMKPVTGWQPMERLGADR